MEAITRDRLFAGAVEPQIMSMRPSELLAGLKQEGLRTRLGNIRIPLEATLNGHGSMSAEDVLLNLRQQFGNVIKSFDMPTQRRLKYFFQFQLTPYNVRQLMPNYAVMSFLPGNRQRLFPPETRFWDVEQLEVITLGTRLHRLVTREGTKPFPIDHFDVRVLLTEIDRDYGFVKLGGTASDENGQNYNRVGLSRMMDFEPGRDPWSIPRDCGEIVDEAIDLHAALELGLAMGLKDQKIPVFPRLYLGFERNDDVVPETTRVLQHAAFNMVRDWLFEGKPTSGPYNWANKLAGAFNCIDPNRLSGWNDIEKQLGTDEANFMLEEAWCQNEIPHDGLTLLPAAFFKTASDQQPCRIAKRVFVDMSDMLGRWTVWSNGRETVDPCMSRIQIFRLATPEVMPVGNFSDWQYDLSSTEIGLEREFK